MSFIVCFLMLIVNFLALSVSFWYADGSFAHAFFGVSTVLNFCFILLVLAKMYEEDENVFSSFEHSLLAFDALLLNELRKLKNL